MDTIRWYSCIRTDFIKELLNIINSPNLSSDPEEARGLLLMALSQLKVYVRQCWPRTKRQYDDSEVIVSAEDQEELRRRILPTMNYIASYKERQLLLDIAELVGFSLCRYYLSNEVLTEYLSHPLKAMSCFWVLLGISKKYQCLGNS
jgi:hypothetical protein